MAIEKFKFVSPGVQFNEVDQSVIAPASTAIGPVVIGRTAKGPAMQPVLVSSVAELERVFGGVANGKPGAVDVWRTGIPTAPTLGTYAARAFLRNSGPVTVIRLGGTSDNHSTTPGYNFDKVYGLFSAGAVENRVDTGSPLTLSTVNGSTILTGSINELQATVNSLTSSNGSDILSGNVAPVLLTQDQEIRFVAGTFTAPVTVVGSSSAGGTFYVTASAIAIAEKSGSAAFWGATGEDTSALAVGQEIRLAGGFAGFTDAANRTITGFNEDGDLFYVTASAAAGAAGSDKTATFYGSGADATLLGLVYTNDATIKISSSVGYTENGAAAVTSTGVVLQVSSGSITKDYPVSFDSSKSNFIRKVLSTNPTKIDSNATTVDQLYFLGETYEETVADPTSVYLTDLGSTLGQFDEVPSNAETPWIVSDHVQLGSPVELFKFVGLNNGTPLSREVKISIENVRASRNTTVTKYGTFDVVVRPLVETAASVPLERFNGVTLDPKSDNYIVKAIGDSWRAYEAETGKYVVYGTTDNRSAYMRVVMTEGDLAAELLPHGYLNKVHGWAETSLGDNSVTYALSLPSAQLYKESISQSSARSKRFGLLVTDDIVDILRHKPEVVRDSEDTELFSTRYINVASGNKYQYTTVYNNTNLLTSGAVLGFDVPFCGGFDGLDITEEEPLINYRILDGKNEYDSYAYRSIKQAIDLAADPETLDMSIICVPGLQEETLTSYMVDVCKNRGDSMALIDLIGDYKYAYESGDNKEFRPTKPGEAGGVVSELINRQIDSSYGAAYFPAVFVQSEGIFLPASIAALGAYGGTEGRSALWFAPAGFNRGGLTEGSSGIGVSRTAYSLNASERDDLYAANINPIATFPGEGVVIFGQKTLQVTPSALDRVNVRRLANFIKKQVSRVATRVLFEPNVEQTWNNFKSIVDPFLLAIKNAYGLDDARVVLDSTTTTADLIDRNIMYCKIYIKPTRAIEYIAIDFIVTNSGAAFSE
jgi:hypothetical protein